MSNMVSRHWVTRHTDPKGIGARLVVRRVVRWRMELFLLGGRKRGRGIARD